MNILNTHSLLLNIKIFLNINFFITAKFQFPNISSVFPTLTFFYFFPGYFTVLEVSPVSIHTEKA